MIILLFSVSLSFSREYNFYCAGCLYCFQFRLINNLQNVSQLEMLFVLMDVSLSVHVYFSIPVCFRIFSNMKSIAQLVSDRDAKIA